MSRIRESETAGAFLDGVIALVRFRSSSTWLIFAGALAGLLVFWVR